MKNNWQKVKLEDVVQVMKRQYVPRGENLNYIGLEHIDQQNLTINSIGSSTELQSNKYFFESNDILFGKLRSYFRKVVKPKFDGVCSTDIMVLRAKKNFDQTFLYYFIADYRFIDISTRSNSGTRMPRADWSYLKELVFEFPDISTQKSIASILSSLDDKIELLREQNKTLEDIAQALFKRWFVDFEFPNEQGKTYKSSGGKMVSSSLGEIPVGWKIGAIGDLVIKTIDNRGKTPITSDVNSDLLFPLVEVNSMVGAGRIVDISKIKKYVDRSTYETWFRAGHPIKKDILVSTVGSIGLVSQIWDERITIAQNIIALRSSSGNFLYQLIAFLREKIIGLNISSVQPSIKVPHLMNLQIILPDADMIELYEYLVESYVSKIHTNNLQIQTLTRLRDSLLPKLMSGELNVEQI